MVTCWTKEYVMKCITKHVHIINGELLINMPIKNGLFDLDLSYLLAININSQLLIAITSYII